MPKGKKAGIAKLAKSAKKSSSKKKAVKEDQATKTRRLLARAE